MGVVIDLGKVKGLPVGSKYFRYTATNYTDLTTVVATKANEGDLAIVYNSQGVWLINRKLKGVYMYQSTVWTYANQELQDILGAKLDSVQSGFNTVIDNTDPLNPIVNYVGGTSIFKSANYTAVNGDDIYVDASLGAFTITLPDATLNNRTAIEITKIDDTLNKITIDSVAGLVAFETSITLNLQAESFRFISNGTNWNLK